MSRNKHIRILIAGQLKTIERHEKKIRDELKKTVPSQEYIKKWEREIDNARGRVRELEERLRQ